VRCGGQSGQKEAEECCSGRHGRGLLCILSVLLGDIISLLWKQRESGGWKMEMSQRHRQPCGRLWLMFAWVAWVEGEMLVDVSRQIFCINCCSRIPSAF
jgi:hypothetical protein